MVQHKVDERIIRYKLETYQKNFPNFICGNLTSTEVLGQDEKNETKPTGTTQEDEVQTKKPHDLREGGQKKKEPHKTQE